MKGATGELVKWYAIALVAVFLFWQFNGQKALMTTTNMSLYLVGVVALLGANLGMAYTNNAVGGAILGFIVYAGMLRMVVGVG